MTKKKIARSNQLTKAEIREVDRRAAIASTGALTRGDVGWMLGQLEMAARGVLESRMLADSDYPRAELEAMGVLKNVRNVRLRLERALPTAIDLEGAS